MPRPVDRATMARLIQVECLNEITRLNLSVDYLNVKRLGVVEMKNLEEIGRTIRQNTSEIEENKQYCAFLDGVIAAEEVKKPDTEKKESV